MEHIDRLLIKAKQSCSTVAGEFMQGFVSFDDARSVFVADARIWVKKGNPSVTRILSEHSTQTVAIEAVQDIAERYPNRRDIVVIIDDIQESG